MPVRNRRQKGLRVSDFAFIGRFRMTVAVEGLKGDNLSWGQTKPATKEDRTRRSLAVDLVPGFASISPIPFSVFGDYYICRQAVGKPLLTSPLLTDSHWEDD